MRVESPTNSVVLSGILFSGDIPVDLVHSLDDHSDVIRLAHGLQRRSGRGSITRKHGSRSGTVDVVGRVTDRTDTGQVG
jgi:hypothetical protein